jgi:3-oxoacyl-[acyl-carrier protein] reductase
MDLVLVDLRAEEMVRTAETLHTLGARVLTFVADTSEFSRAGEIAAEVLGSWGSIDVLVNNAGRSSPKGLLEITEAEWDAAIDVNLKSCFNWCRAVAGSMLERGRGRIVSISSVNAHSGGVTTAVSKFAYAAAKAGILGLTRALAKELGPSITVNAVCPGVIATDATAEMLAERSRELVSGIVLGRLGRPADVAEVVAFLATVEPNFITGQALTVDGFLCKL